MMIAYAAGASLGGMLFLTPPSSAGAGMELAYRVFRMGALVVCLCVFVTGLVLQAGAREE